MDGTSRTAPTHSMSTQSWIMYNTILNAPSIKRRILSKCLVTRRLFLYLNPEATMVAGQNSKRQKIVVRTK